MEFSVIYSLCLLAPFIFHWFSFCCYNPRAEAALRRKSHVFETGRPGQTVHNILSRCKWYDLNLRATPTQLWWGIIIVNSIYRLYLHGLCIYIVCEKGGSIHVHTYIYIAWVIISCMHKFSKGLWVESIWKPSAYQKPAAIQTIPNTSLYKTLPLAPISSYVGRTMHVHIYLHTYIHTYLLTYLLAYLLTYLHTYIH